MIAATRVANEVLIAILDPAHWPAEPHRGPGHGHSLALQVGLEAERAAHVGANDAQASLRDAQDL